MNATERLTSAVKRGMAAVLVLLTTAALSQAQTSEKRATIADVRVFGTRYVPTEYVMQRVRTRPGMIYEPAVVQEDVRGLYKTNRFRSVDVRKTPLADGRVIITFEVIDFPNRIQEIVYKLPHNTVLEVKELGTLTGLQEGLPLNPIVNKIACQQIVRYLREKGYPFASCTLVEGGKTTDSRVVVAVTEGPQVFVRSISFEGNSWLTGARLRTLINSKRLLLSKNYLVTRKLTSRPYVPAMVEADVKTLTEYYRAFGFHDVQVRREIQRNMDNRTVDLVFHIYEGKRYRVQGAPRVVGSKHFEEDELLRACELKAGEHYDQKTIREDLSRIKNYIGYTGRQARVEEKITYNGIAQCSVNYQVTDEPPARVGDVIIVGNDVTKQNVILRQILLYPGQILSYPAIRQSEARLTRLGIFKVDPATGVRPTITVLDRPDGDPAIKDILVQIQEDRTGSLLFGVGFNSDAGATGSIVLNERNFDLFNVPTSLDELLSGRAFRGAGQELRLEAVPGTELQRYSFSFREPYLFDSEFAFNVGGYYYTRRYTEYDERRLGGRFGISRRLGDAWTVSTNVRVENVEVRNVPFFAPNDYLDVQGDNFQFGVSLGVAFDTRDSIIRATQGSLANLSVEGVTGDADFPIVTASFSKYFTMYQRNDGSGRHVLALRSQVGYTGANAPVFERFFAGGFRTLRGFEFRGVGPQKQGFKVGGDFLLLNSAEYSIPVTANDQVQFVAFVDSGTVEDRVEINNYRVSAGFGLRLTVPFMGPVPIALDFGFPIVKGPFDNEQIFNFYLGLQR